MAYKKIDNYFSFADIAIQNNADKNRSLIFLNKVNASIDWTFKNDKYHYGLKEHTAVDTDNGLILSTTLSPGSHHDSK